MKTNMLDLSQLRDLHLPVSPRIWPLAPGWWIVLIGLLMIIGFFLYYRYRKNKPKKIALSLINQLQASGDISNYGLAALSRLIRQIALSRFKREEIASLHGYAWLAFLDRTGKTQNFSTGAGQALAEAPYQASPNIDQAALFECVKQWVRVIYD